MTTCDNGISRQKVGLGAKYMTNNFRLRFDASLLMSYYQIDWVSLECVYSKNDIQCNKPGQSLVFNVTR